MYHLAGSQFFKLASLFADYLLSGGERQSGVPGGDAIQGIKPLMIAIQRIQDSKSAIPGEPSSLYDHQVCGSLNKEFAKLCLKAKCYQHSLKVIDYPVISFLKGTQPMDILSYFYYKGLLYTGL